MQIIDQYTGLDVKQTGAAIALGNFDGVHKGHLEVIGSAASVAKKFSCPLGVAVFHPHPKKFFVPSAEPSRLQSNAARAKSLSDLGSELLYRLPFDRAMSMMSDREFAAQVLRDGLKVRHVSVGENYRFGRDRMGDVASLATLGEEFGFSVAAIKMAGNANRYSSTAVREALMAGDCKTATEMLGRMWSVQGRVEFGQQRGRTIGVPTANLSLGEYIRPRFGVYAAFAQVEGEGVLLPGVVNIGTRPTMDGKEERLEIHLFDFTGDLYGRLLEVSLLEFIRDEKKFDGLPALQEQIAKDIKTARQLTAVTLPVDRASST
jgi:riboflavin kinase/FMN adenylyltransferase